MPDPGRQTRQFQTILITTFLIITMGCSSAKKKTNSETSEKEVAATSAESTEKKASPKKSENEKLVRHINRLNKRIASLEKKLSAMNIKVNQTQKSLDHLVTTKSQRKKNPHTVNVKPHPDSGYDVFEPGKISQRNKQGFMDSEVIHRYRAAKVFFEADQFSEAILELTAFLKDFGDHSLAGAAQFYIGEAYYQQKEWKLAREEFNQFLLSYPYTSFVTDSLKRLVEIEEKLKMSEEAQKHRQILYSLFPHSPAAAEDLAKDTKLELKKKKESQTTLIDEIPPPTAPLPWNETEAS